MTANRVVGWLGWSSLEAICRISLLIGSTAVFSRYLEAQDFGIVAIVIVAMTLAANFAGIPFEQPLAQHPGLERAHVETAFTVSMATAALMLALSFPVGALIAAAYDAPVIAQLLPVAAVSIFFSAYSDLLRGVARRQRRFTEIAIASLVGHIIGISIALTLLFAGFGVWALLFQRVLAIVFQAITMGAIAGFTMKLGFCLEHFNDLRRYASIQLVDRLAENLNYFAFNFIVASFYGLTVLGYVNMALRIVEPIRGAALSMSHNVAFYYFTTTGMSARGNDILWRSGLACSPIFLGLAAVIPVLLPIVVGPEWEPAIPIAIFLCIGSALFLPSRLVFTALAARARPEYGVISNIVGAITTIVVLVAAAGFAPFVVGVARATGDFVQAALAVALPHRIVGWTRMARLTALASGWLIAAAMALVVTTCTALLSDYNDLVVLVLAVSLGVLVYTTVLAFCARSFMREVVHSVVGERRA